MPSKHPLSRPPPRLLRIGKLLKYARHNAKYYGLLSTSLVMGMGAHVFVSFWVLVHHDCIPNEDGVIENPACNRNDMMATYLETLFYIICLMLGVASPPLQKKSGIFRENAAETEDSTSISTFILGAVIVLSGFALFAVLLAHVHVVVSGWNQVEAKFRTKMVREFYRNV